MVLIYIVFYIHFSRVLRTFSWHLFPPFFAGRSMCNFRFVRRIALYSLDSGNFVMATENGLVRVARWGFIWSRWAEARSTKLCKQVQYWPGGARRRLVVRGLRVHTFVLSLFLPQTLIEARTKGNETVCIARPAEQQLYDNTVALKVNDKDLYVQSTGVSVCFVLDSEVMKLNCYIMYLVVTQVYAWRYVAGRRISENISYSH